MQAKRFFFFFFNPPTSLLLTPVTHELSILHYIIGFSHVLGRIYQVKPMLGWQDKSQLIDPVSLKFKGRNYQVKTRARFMQSHVAMIVV